MTYVRDDRPFGGADPPAVVFYYSRDRRGEHPAAHLAGWSGILQADAYGGYGDLYAAGRQPAPILEASCWAHSRRKVFELAEGHRERWQVIWCYLSINRLTAFKAWPIFDRCRTITLVQLDAAAEGFDAR